MKEEIMYSYLIFVIIFIFSNRYLYILVIKFKSLFIKNNHYKKSEEEEATFLYLYQQMIINYILVFLRILRSSMTLKISYSHILKDLKYIIKTTMKKN